MTRARSWISGLPVLGAVIVSVAGCSVGDLTIVQGELRDGGNRDSGVSSRPVPPGEFGAELAKAICENIGPCCAAEGKPHDPRACEKALSTAPLTGDLSGYDARALGQCIEAYRSAVRSCFGVPAVNAANGVCPPDVIGNGPPSRASTGERCDGNCHTSRELRACTGQVVNQPPAPEGGTIGSVSGASGMCFEDDGLYCPSVGVTPSTCVQRGGVGTPCAEPDACKGSWCNGTTCVPFRESGDSCSDTLQCNVNLYCDVPSSGAGTCLQRKIDGAPCDSGRSCISGLCTGSHGCENLFLTSFTGVACVPP